VGGQGIGRIVRPEYGYVKPSSPYNAVRRGGMTGFPNIMMVSSRQIVSSLIVLYIDKASVSSMTCAQ
jgi:hypothetical protein